jgi:hypothetical protein
MSTIEADLDRVLALAKSQRPDPEGWSLAVDSSWLQRSFFRPGVASLPACAVRRPAGRLCLRV